MGVTEKAVNWAVAIAADQSHGYSQVDRWGPDYDCSSFVISAFEQAGVAVREAGASYALQACLDGLEQLGANHNVPEAKDKLSKYINQQAHDQLD